MMPNQKEGKTVVQETGIELCENRATKKKPKGKKTPV